MSGRSSSTPVRDRQATPLSPTEQPQLHKISHRPGRAPVRTRASPAPERFLWRKEAGLVLPAFAQDGVHTHVLGAFLRRQGDSVRGLCRSVGRGGRPVTHAARGSIVVTALWATFRTRSVPRCRPKRAGGAGLGATGNAKRTPLRPLRPNASSPPNPSAPGGGAASRVRRPRAARLRPDVAGTRAGRPSPATGSSSTSRAIARGASAARPARTATQWPPTGRGAGRTQRRRHATRDRRRRRGPGQARQLGAASRIRADAVCAPAWSATHRQRDTPTGRRRGFIIADQRPQFLGSMRYPGPVRCDVSAGR